MDEKNKRLLYFAAPHHYMNSMKPAKDFSYSSFLIFSASVAFWSSLLLLISFLLPA
jgi:hypothetical protein